MKVGDKLYCIRGHDDMITEIKLGNSYIVRSVNKICFSIMVETGYGGYSNMVFYNHPYDISLSKPRGIMEYDRYFNNLTAIRKLKLKKIQDESR